PPGRRSAAAMTWTPADLDRLERAIMQGTRVQFFRRGTEHIVVPQFIRSRFGRDVLHARRVGTGETDEFALDEIDDFDVLS
ncbi:MAG TPA: hypothetical protein VF625_04595, partial [Longimicrobium sp.]